MFNTTARLWKRKMYNTLEYFRQNYTRLIMVNFSWNIYVPQNKDNNISQH